MPGCMSRVLAAKDPGACSSIEPSGPGPAFAWLAMRRSGRKLAIALPVSVEVSQPPPGTIARRESIRAAGANVQAVTAKGAGTRFQNVGFVRLRPGELRMEKAHEDGQPELPYLAGWLGCGCC